MSVLVHYITSYDIQPIRGHNAAIISYNNAKFLSFCCIFMHDKQVI